jgi:predicted RND superfamily exporter protein
MSQRPARPPRSPAWLREALGRTSRASARHRVPVLLLTGLAVALLALGLPQLRFEDNPVDAMPTGDPNTLATLNVTREFPGAAFASPVFVGVDPAKWAAANARLPNRVPLGGSASSGGPPTADDVARTVNAVLHGGQPPAGSPPPPTFPDPWPGARNITDEVYMRGQNEVFRFLQQRVPEMRWAITLESQVRLVNYTNTGVPGAGVGPTAKPAKAPDAAAFTMPGTDPEGERQYASAWTTYFVASPASVRSIVSKDWASTRLAYLFEPGGKTLAEVGQDLYRAVDAYKAEVAACDAGKACSLEWNVFDRASILVDPRGAPASAAHLSDTTREDVFVLAPVAALFVGACLLLQFRRPGTVAAMVLPLGLSGLGVLGAFGLLGLRIQSASLLVFPVLIGTGIDFGIHMAAAYHTARRGGEGVAQASFAAGQHAGRPLLIATVTTLVDMLFLILAPNQLLRELGFAILLGLSMMMLVSLTALPAALSFCATPKRKGAPMDRFLLGNARFWGRNKPLGWGVVGATALAGLLVVPQLQTLVIGTPAAFFPKGDAQRGDFEASNDRYFRSQQDLVSNVLVFEGDLTTPAAMAELADMEQAVKGLPFVRQDSAVSIHFAMNAWVQVRQGTAGAPAVIAQEAAKPGSTFPQTQADIKAVLDEMFQTPLANYISFFISPHGYRIGVMLVEIDQPADFAVLAPQWTALQGTVAQVQARHPDAHLQVHTSGASAIAYLFTAKELPYLQIAGYLGIAVTALQIWLFRRSLREAVVVSLCVLAAGAWWGGLLVLSHIPLSIALVVPLVILEAIGSDYAMHLLFALSEEGQKAWETVGRAIVYAAVTDLGAFLVFAFMRYGLLRQAALATVYVLLCALVATLVLVPVLSRRRDLPLPAPSSPARSLVTP